ncbi:hypothetical protein M569_00760 [Genlisea aurea]|uniref:Uncharacterized protein n=1 Tax=Genlisea aurea TaxID=192259 RepID=S8D979_9LAMI|nr:hypothetical protein M569_00760 [Genlisea aurea]
MALPVLSRSIVHAEEKSVMTKLKLSIPEMMFLSVPYIKMGYLFESPPFPTSELILKLKTALSRTLTHFPVLAGRLITDDEGFVYVTCNDQGADLIHVDGSSLTTRDLTEYSNDELPKHLNHCFPADLLLGSEGFSKPLLVVQVTELADGVSITVNMREAIADGISYLNFFLSFAELSSGLTEITHFPDFHRDSILMSNVAPKLPSSIVQSGNYLGKISVEQKVFKFRKETIQRLKTQINETEGNNTKISSLQCLFALLWRSITRARNLPPSKKTSFMFTINCRHRVEPKLDPFCFGNAVQIINVTATAKEVAENGLFWCAREFNDMVTSHDFSAVKNHVETWEYNPQPLTEEILDGTKVYVVGFSPHLSMNEYDFGWGKPISILYREGVERDGMVIPIPGRDGGIDLRLILAPETMKNLEGDPEFMMCLA